MCYTTIKIGLVRQAGAAENGLTFMALFRWKDSVSFSRRDGQWVSNSLQLFDVYVAWVCDVSCVYLIGIRL